MNNTLKILKHLFLLIACCNLNACGQSSQSVLWISTTDNERWVNKEVPAAKSQNSSETIRIDLKNTAQTIDGFGGCFNELGWEALNLVSPAEKKEILNNLFNPVSGCKFNICRMPLGASDYALDWYSLNETPGDYNMENFSIARDQLRLIPYIKAAKEFKPDLKVWASPWSPPSWMKTNNYYACRSAEDVERMREMMKRMRERTDEGTPGERPPMGDKPEGTPGDRPPMGDRPEGTPGNRPPAGERPEGGMPAGGFGEQGNATENQFIMDEKTLSAYGLYFSKFIQEYKKEGIDVYAVHVQNEPNSCQIFPSCQWTPEGLNQLVKTIGKQFEKDGLKTEVWLGTIERGLPSSVDPILGDPEAVKYLTGVGFQWAGKNVIGYVNKTYPDLKLMQTETECGDGSNDWEAMEYTFSLMKQYFENGANTYLYWNMILTTGESTWGWLQNSMITITDDIKVRYNPEFYLMKHLSYFVQPNAKYINLAEDENCLAFVNPGDEIIVVYYNKDEAPATKTFEIGNFKVNVELKEKSLNTFSVKL